MFALQKRLTEWTKNWKQLEMALQRDSSLPANWPVRPWLFVPERCITKVVAILTRIDSTEDANLKPKITTLEMTPPWLYKTWDRTKETQKPISIPVDMMN